MVLIGVFGEGLELAVKKFRQGWFLKYEHKIETWGLIFWALVVIGLAWEFGEIARVDKEAADSSRLAGLANERAEQLANETEKLREQNIKLAIQLGKLRQPRWLTFNGQAFAEALKNSPKMDVQIWYPTNDTESASLVNLELLDALKRANWNVAEVREFMPVYSFELEQTPFSVKDGLDINRLSVRVSTDIFWETVGDVWDRDGLKTAPKSLSKAFESSGVCWRPVTPEAYWGVNPIPTNTIRIIIFPKNL